MTSPNAGDPVIVMGYPTGLRALLVQAGDEFLRQIGRIGDTDFWSIAARLAEEGHIAPLASRGIVAKATGVAVLYDAETTVGGSGGPVLDLDGSVVAVTSATIPGFSGSNIGVPVEEVWALMKAAGAR